jgi:hypothetical protein
MAALAEVYSHLLDAASEASELLDKVFSISYEFNFAGFRVALGKEQIAMRRQRGLA